MPDKKLTDKLKTCPHCDSDMTVIREELIFGIIPFESKIKCCACGFALTEKTTKKAIKKWNRGG